LDERRAAENAELKSSPTAYVSLIDMAYLEDGDAVFLDLRAPRAKAKWAKAQPRGESLAARRTGAEIALSWSSGKSAALSLPRRIEPAGNGLIVQAFNPGAPRVLLGLHDPGGPRQSAFPGKKFFPFRRDAIVEARFTPAPLKEVAFATSLQRTTTFYLVGDVRFRFGGENLLLNAYSYGGEPTKIHELFVPFRDATTGKASYGGGRYLDVKIPGAAEPARVILDFNLAYNPMCAYSPFFNCVIVPGNKLALAVEAGEKAPAKH
jgi:uncharacterized protein